MKIRFILLTVLMTGSIFASKESATKKEIDIQAILLKSLLALSVYEHAVTQNTPVPAQEPKPVKQKNIYKPMPKQDKRQRRKQTNRPIQQYRRR